MTMYSKILVPVDGSDTARRGLVEAIAFAKSTGGQIRLVHVVNELIFGYPYGGGHLPAISPPACAPRESACWTAPKLSCAKRASPAGARS